MAIRVSRAPSTIIPIRLTTMETQEATFFIAMVTPAG
jgi:hypothetical protein